MENKNINLDFLYYQRVAVLDGVDPKEEKLKKTARVFKKNMKEYKLNEVIQLIIYSYKENYAQHKFFSACFYDVKTGLDRPQEPEGIGKYDQYMSKQNMARKDIEHSILRIFKDDYEKTNARFLKEMELLFVDNQELKDSVEEALEGKEFSKNEDGEITIYKVEDSPIAEIELSPKKFVLRTNSDKWKAYY